MEILKEAPDCYVHHCSHCGAILKYSELDIRVGGMHHDHHDKNGTLKSFYFKDDTIVCPCCKEVEIPERRFFYKDW